MSQREFQILTAMAMLGDAAWALNIQQKIESWGVPANLGTTYVVLERLELRGLVEAKWLDPAKQDRRLYLLTNAGERALARARAEGKALVKAEEDQPKGPCTERIR